MLGVANHHFENVRSQKRTTVIESFSESSRTQLASIILVVWLVFDLPRVLYEFGLLCFLFLLSSIVIGFLTCDLLNCGLNNWRDMD